MPTDIPLELSEAEKTEDWDAQKLRHHVGKLRQVREQMTDHEERRFQCILSRFRAKMNATLYEDE